MQGGNNPGA
jgi:hypothetical protein